MVLILSAWLAAGGANVGTAQEKQDGFKFVDGKDLHEITLLVQRETGVRFLWNEDLGLRNKRVNFTSPDAVKGKAEILSLYRHLLGIHNLILIPLSGVGEDRPAYQIVPVALGVKSATRVEREGKAPTGRFVTRIFHLKAVDPREAHRSLINVVSSPQGILPIESSRSLIVTDFDHNVRRCEEILREIDRPVSALVPHVVWEVVPLRNRKVTGLSGLLQALVQPLTALVNLHPRIQDPGEKIRILEDKETNSLVILAPVERMKALKRIIQDLDRKP